MTPGGATSPGAEGSRGPGWMRGAGANGWRGVIRGAGMGLG